MNSTITATIKFDYKGESHAPSAVLDLDLLMQQHSALPELHALVAKLNNIDSYSYQYELLLGEEIQFSAGQGLAGDFISGEQFDKHAFELCWRQQQLLQQLSPALKQTMSIDDIEQHPALKSLLLSAYQLGTQSKN